MRLRSSAPREPRKQRISASGEHAGDSVPGVPTLAERLGYTADDRLVIISCDDLGSCHAANEGVFAALHDGVATCASLMVPAPWARDAAVRARPTDDLGVHLTLNCEHPNYRWGPITH